MCRELMLSNVVSGIGLGLFYLPNIIAVSYYFSERRALATGIAVCGTGVGCFTFAPLAEFLLDVYDWKNAMLIVAGITLNGCVFGGLLRPLVPPRRPTRRRPRAKNILDRLKEQTAQRMGRTRTESECSAIPGTDRNTEVSEVKVKVFGLNLLMLKPNAFSTWSHSLANPGVDVQALPRSTSRLTKPFIWPMWNIVGSCASLSVVTVKQ